MITREDQRNLVRDYDKLTVAERCNSLRAARTIGRLKRERQRLSFLDALGNRSLLSMTSDDPRRIAYDKAAQAAER